jgi:radical SAM superfamily enzyme YgiQ (UPF0313 family)
MYDPPAIRVLLISPSSTRFYVPTAPLGLSTIAGALSDEVEVCGLDLNVLKWIHGLDSRGLLGTFEHYLKKTVNAGVPPSIIGITVYQETLDEAIGIARIAKDYGIPTVAGGIYPTLFPEKITGDFRFIVRGEGTLPFCRLIDVLKEDSSSSTISYCRSVPGLACYTQDGWSHTEPYEPVGFEKDHIPNRTIFNHLNMGFRYFSARIQSSKGCPYKCSFCANSEYSKRQWQAREVEEVLAEVVWILQDPNIHEISFADDQFLGCRPVDYCRALAILEGIRRLTKKRNVRINLQVRADQFLRALAEQPRLESVMCSINEDFQDDNPEISTRIHGRPVRGFSLDIGLESNLQSRLNKMVKTTKVQDNLKSIEKARDLGLDLGVYMILFTPDLTLEELRKEWKIYRDSVLKSDLFSKAAFFSFFQELIPYQGTQAYRRVKEQGCLVEEGNFTGFHFQDMRTAAFYLLYQLKLNLGGFDAATSMGAMLRLIEDLLKRSEGIAGISSNIAVLSELVCETREIGVLEQMYRQLKHP